MDSDGRTDGQAVWSEDLASDCHQIGWASRRARGSILHLPSSLSSSSSTYEAWRGGETDFFSQYRNSHRRLRSPDDDRTIWERTNDQARERTIPQKLRFVLCRMVWNTERISLFIELQRLTAERSDFTSEYRLWSCAKSAENGTFRRGRLQLYALLHGISHANLIIISIALICITHLGV